MGKYHTYRISRAKTLGKIFSILEKLIITKKFYLGRAFLKNLLNTIIAKKLIFFSMQVPYYCYIDRHLNADGDQSRRTDALKCLIICRRLLEYLCNSYKPFFNLCALPTVLLF